MINIYVKEFSQYPGPRKEVVGPHSGERFRDDVIYKKIQENQDEEIKIILDGTAGYGSSFLEEAFGGLVRLGVSEPKMTEIVRNLVSEEDPSLIEEIREYVKEAFEELKG